jgi:hypothetical protein
VISDQMLLSLVPEIHGRSGRRRERHQRRPRSPHDHHRGAAREQLPDGRDPPAWGDPQVRRGDARRDHERSGHLRLEAEPDRDAGEHEPARPAVLQRAHDEPQRRHRTEDQERVRVVVARDRDGDRRQGEHQPGDEPAGAAEAPAHEVVHERDRGDPHQRLGDEQAQRVKAEDLHRQRLHPQRERRLVHRHDAGCIERAVQERVPARAHRPHGGAVVVVREAVAVERPEVQQGGEDEQRAELGSHARE